MSLPSFAGSAEQQDLATEIFRLMIGQGALFANDSPIRQTLNNLADFLASQHKRDRETLAQEIDAALRANSQVFTREEHNGEVLYVTSRLGAFKPAAEDTRHMFKQRLYEPENPLPVDDISVVVSTSRPALTTVEPVFISDYWQRQAGLMPVEPASDETAQLPVTETLAPAEMAPEAAPFVPAEPEPAAVAPPAALEAQPPGPPAAPAEVPAPASSNTIFTLADGTPIDIAQPIDAIMAKSGDTLNAALLARLDQDPLRRIVSFGRSLYPEASVINLGKNDLRKIREYILERNEPLLDTEIIADLYYHNPRQGDYEGFRFSLNYRLHREKDFEFVGVEGARLWSTKGLPTIGVKRLKASEMHQITAFLTDGLDDSLELQSADSIKASGSANRLLTFFEWDLGVLPFDANLAALLPRPMLPDQRSAVLRIHSPQHYTDYLVEVRYPTANRGGWLQGLEEFFHEHLVPGALITLSHTSEPNVFNLTYEEAPATEERLLTFDEKKNKFAFNNITFYCAVDGDRLPNQQRFGRLRNLKSLPMNERRKGDVVLAHVFETLGEQMGTRSEPRYWLSLDDLYVGYTVLRPASRSYLLSLLKDDPAYQPDSSTPGAYTYTPAPEERASGDDGEEEEEVMPEVTRRRGRYSDDDE